MKIEKLTEIHSLENINEKKRIEFHGGKIIDNRVGGGLIITRSIGDFDLKKHGVTSYP